MKKRHMPFFHAYLGYTIGTFICYYSLYMETEGIYTAGIAPPWVETITDDDLTQLILTRDADAETTQRRNSGSLICQVKKKIISSSSTVNHEYNIQAWTLSTPDLLQGASASEVHLRNAERFTLHRVAVIRNGIYIDKLPEFTVRILDDESSSSLNSLTKRKKLHYVISDVRLGDIFIMENSIVHDFANLPLLDTEYALFSHSLPDSHWYYSHYYFALLQHRDKNILVKKRYARSASGEREKDEVTSVPKGGSFIFQKFDYVQVYQKDTFVPFFEIATDATWESIAAYLHELYIPVLEKALAADTLERIGINSKTSTEATIRDVIEYMQNSIIYLYDAEVMHGFIPQAAETTLAVKAGDCKAKSILLQKLLALINVNSEVIFVNYSRDRYINLDLPSPYVFNHAIVKISYGGETFLVDPTWRNNAGFLEFRAQPIIASYLSSKGTEGLVQVAAVPPKGCFVEEETTITITRAVAHLTILGTYRFNAADGTRKNFTTNDPEPVKNQYIERTLSRLGRPSEKGLLKQPHLEIVSDDRDRNEIQILFTAEFSNAYEISRRNAIFRYYYAFDDANLLTVTNKDQVYIASFYFHTRYSLHISSDRFLRPNVPLARRNTLINNPYFTFSNTKKASFRSVHVVSEFIPKSFGVIKPGDIQTLQDDIKTIQDSNFGVGVVFYTRNEHIFYAICVTIALIYIFYLVLTTP